LATLRNLLDIRDRKQLDLIEASFVTIRTWELERTSFDKTFDLQHLKAIHKHLFQDIYEWAGEIRLIDMGKGDTVFSPRSFIEPSSKDTFDRLKEKNYLKGMDANDFSKNAGYYLGVINDLHPFREGNGRTQREFINQLAHYNGYHIEWKNISKKQMNDASIEACKGQTKGLATLIRENLIDRDRLLAIDQGETYRGAHAKVCLAEAGKNYEGSIIGSTERYVMQALIDSPNHVIIHNRPSLSRMPEINKTVEISYPHGDIGLVREPEIVKEMNLSKTNDLGKNSHQHEEHGWER
jgi:cell filamentation protein